MAKNSLLTKSTSRATDPIELDARYETFIHYYKKYLFFLAQTRVAKHQAWVRPANGLRTRVAAFSMTWV